ncbi:MAG: hypothetical protein CMF91_02185 [Candidatus Marinimicrobia bacterium]|nr:hypothetical protein [Candidatus Neomarinimicrobiota bacterium]|tara:strand:+ start:246 stop:1460 length:1215 start_codon:yes stop_codon:yes gene_type:complete
MKLFDYVSRTFLVMAFAMLCSFIATLKLGEVLTMENFGFFNLLKRIFPMGAAIILLGIDKSYIKYFSKVDKMKIFHFLLPLILFNSMILTLIIGFLYDFNGYDLSIFICLVIFSFTLFLTSYSRLKDEYATAQFIQAGHKIIFFISILGITAYYDINSIEIINIFLFAFLLPCLYFFKYLYDERSINVYIPTKEFKKIVSFGFLFFLVNILNLMIVNMEGLFIPYYYGQEANGIYSGLSFIYITVFVMIGTSIGYVLFPMLSKKEEINLKSLFFYTSVIVFVISFIFIFFGDSINSIAFKGKFDYFRTFKVDLMIILIGALQFINGLFHWFILGLGTKKNIIDYLKIIILTLITYFLSVVFITNFFNLGFLGIIPTVLVAWIFKVSITFYFIFKTNIISNYLKY